MSTATHRFPPFAWARLPFDRTAAATLLAEAARDPDVLAGNALVAECGALLHERLRQCDALDRLPTAAAAALRQERHRVLAQNVAFLAELDRVLAALAGGGIRVLLLKGAALLELGVFTAAERPMSDLDLLVADADVSAAGAVLVRLGFRLDNARTAAYEDRYAGQRGFLRETPAGSCWVDLHRDLFAVDWLRGEGAGYRADCWNCAVSLPGRPGAAVLDPADQAVHVCLHWVLHHGLGGVWPAIDLAATTGQDGFTWERFVQRARASGWPAAVYLALRRAAALTGAPAPVLSSLVPNPLRRALLDRLFAADTRLFPPTAAAQATRFLHLVAAEPGRALRLISRAIWPEREWLALRYDEEIAGGEIAVNGFGERIPRMPSRVHRARRHRFASPMALSAVQAIRRVRYLARLAGLAVHGIRQIVFPRV